jgi:uncharacterized protein (DUF2235 family)
MPKNIVICSDGTGNTAIKGRGTNVFKLYEAVDIDGHRTDPAKIPQIAFYDDGVGTQRLKLLKLLSGAFGLGLGHNVRQLYANLARTYDPGDRLYLFGFSRGAFTVRTLAGLVTNCGIVDLTKCRWDDDLWARVEEAYKAYRDRYSRGLMRYLRRRMGRELPEEPPSVRDFRERWAVHDKEHASGGRVKIEFIGVWDTVDAVGFPVPWLADLWNGLVYPFRFPDHRLSTHVKRACHALAIDDERQTFHPLLWDETKEAPHRIQQVWFAGVHSSVGGGYPKQGMSLVPLVWMMEEAEKAGLKGAGLRFSGIDRQQYHERQNVDDKLYDSRAGLAFFYRYRPRDIAKMCEKKQIIPKLHTSAVERIVDGPDGYAPGNIPSQAQMSGPGNPVLPLQPTLSRMQTKLKQDSSLLDRVRGLIRARQVSQYVVMILTVIVLLLAFRGGLRGATLDSWLDLLSPAGLLKLVGGFLVSAARGARWGVFWLVVLALVAYGFGWFAASRMKRIFSEFWYDVRR